MRFLPFVVPVVFGLLTIVPPTTASAQVGIAISVRLPPPALPFYVQPPLPEPGYIWTPGYWAYADNGGYYWIPGTWVLPPSAGLLWTPAWWGFSDGFYGFHEGYWGPTVGFYGGINYGYGYNGSGFIGGRWDHGSFAYNSAVNNFGHTHVTNVFRQGVAGSAGPGRTSFNGGTGGVRAQPNADQGGAEHAQHVAPAGVQAQHIQAAAATPALRATANHGRPAIAATARPGEFSGRGVVAARAGARTAGPGGGHRPAATNTAVRPAVQHQAAPHPTAHAAPAEHAAPAHANGEEDHHR